MVPLFLAVYIPCSIVILVPVDLLSSSQNSHPLFYLSERVRLVLWRIIYWLAFVLTWLIMPVLQYYCESGYHEPWKRFKDALRRNARFQLSMLGAGVIGLIYVILTSGLSPGSIKALVIALSHCYALLLAIWLLGHGLVNVPRALWQEAEPRDLLQSRYKNASRVSDIFAESQATYANVAAEIKALAPYKDCEYLDWIDELLDEVHDGPTVPRTGYSQTTVDRSIINEQYLSSLASRYYKAKARTIRYEADWQKLLKDCSKAEDIINARLEGKSLVFRFAKTSLPPRMAYIYFTIVQPKLLKLLAMLLAAMSAILVWSEATHGTFLSVVNIMVSNSHGVGQQLLSTLILGFMCVCDFASLTSIRIFNVYALVHRSSDTSSLIFYAMYACRLTVPLSYNYLTLVSSKESVFEEFLGKSINLTLLGKYYNDMLPRLVIIPVLLTLFHFYDRIKNLLGFGMAFDDEQDEDGTSGSVIEGRALVERALTDPRSHYAISNIIPPSDSSGPRCSFDRFEDRSRSLPREPRASESPQPRQSQQEHRVLGRNQPTERANEALNNVKFFFGSLGRQVQERFEELTQRNSDSQLPRWSRLNGSN